MKNRLLFLALLLLPAFGVQAQHITEYKTISGTQRLVANGKPLLLLSGELHNSTSASEESLDAAMKTVKAMGLNSVISAITWEQLEPQKGKFDYTVTDYTVKLAQQYGMRVVVLWFGTWKNGESSYVPVWVKTDSEKYFLARKADGTKTTTISPFCEEACKADANAFAKMMERIKAKDTQGLISVIQVENETGTFADIDHSSASLKAFSGEVPATLINYMSAHKNSLYPRLLQRWNENGNRKNGTWKDVFGDNNDSRQFFMTWAYATYCNRVAKAGKDVYPLPMYMNCWLANDDDKPGSFPCGGPEAKVLDIYKAFAPNIDWLSPDIYVPDFRSICGKYHRTDNPLFTPETQREAGPAYYAFGEHNAICYAPFAIEESYNDKYLLGEYRVLGELLPFIAANQGTGHMHGFMRQEGTDAQNDSTTFTMGDYRIMVKYIKGEHRAHGLIVQTAKDEFIVAGVGAFLNIHSLQKSRVCRLAYAEELKFEGNTPQTLLVLNGDETAHHSMLYLRGRMPNADYKEYGFDIPAPWTDVSSFRIYVEDWQKRYKVSGIYRIKVYSYPEK